MRERGLETTRSPVRGTQCICSTGLGDCTREIANRQMSPQIGGFITESPAEVVLGRHESHRMCAERHVFRCRSTCGRADRHIRARGIGAHCLSVSDPRETGHRTFIRIANRRRAPNASQTTRNGERLSGRHPGARLKLPVPPATGGFYAEALAWLELSDRLGW